MRASVYICVCVTAKGTESVRVCVWQTDVVPKRLALSDKESNTACSCVYYKRHWWFLQYNTLWVWLIGTGSPIAQKLCAGIELCVNTLVNVRGWFRCGHWGCLRERTQVSAHKKAGPGFDTGEAAWERSAASSSGLWMCTCVCVQVFFFPPHFLLHIIPSHFCCDHFLSPPSFRICLHNVNGLQSYRLGYVIDGYTGSFVFWMDTFGRTQSWARSPV